MYKNQFKMDQRPKYKIWNNKLHRRTYRYWTYGPWLQRTFYECDPKDKGSKANISEWNYIKLKSFCSAKEMTKKPIKEWEKIFSNNSSNKRLISKIYKELIKLNIKQTIQLKMGRGPEQTPLQRQTATRYVKRYSTSLAIREKQIKSISSHTC